MLDTNVDRLYGQLERGDLATRLVEHAGWSDRLEYTDGHLVTRTSSRPLVAWRRRLDPVSDGYRSPDDVVAALRKRLTSVGDKGLQGALARLNRPYGYQLALLNLTPSTVRFGIRVLSPEKVQAIFDHSAARLTGPKLGGPGHPTADDVELQVVLMTERLRSLLADAVEYSLLLDAVLDRWERRERRGALVSLVVRAVSGS